MMESPREGAGSKNGDFSKNLVFGFGFCLRTSPARENEACFLSISVVAGNQTARRKASLSCFSGLHHPPSLGSIARRVKRKQHPPPLEPDS